MGGGFVPETGNASIRCHRPHCEKSSRALVCLHPEETHFGKAAAFLRKHLDQRYSFVDCSSMVIAKELGLERVLTTAHHFQACGFETPLLR